MDLNTLEGLVDINGDAIVGGDDLLGLMDIGGMDDDFMGAAFGLPTAMARPNPRANAMALMKQRALMAKRVQQGTLIRSMSPIAERRLSIGFAAANIAANSTVAITVQPQWAFKGQKLSVPSAIVNFFDILSVQIGAINQFPAPGAQPASAFADVSVGTNMEMDTCNLGQLITLTVQNVDPGAAHTFKASLFGKAIITAPCRR